jgi:hypothetical protein
MKHDKPEHAPRTPSPADMFTSMLTTDALERSASVFGKGMRTFQEEGLKFWNRRIEDNAKAVRQFAACKSLPDVFAAQQKWFADMTRAYSEEWARYSELMTGIFEEEEGEKANGRAGRSSHH